MKTRKPMSADSDTDSVASSTASFQFNLEKRQKKGVSPLNRRRSLRLAEAARRLQLDRDTTMREGYTHNQPMKSQNTVIMQSPVQLQRMETSTRWKDWRRRSTMAKQETALVAPATLKRKTSAVKGPKKWVKWREGKKTEGESQDSTLSVANAEAEEGSSQLPTLLSKQTTTTTLRLAMAHTKLESISEAAGPVPSTSSGTKSRLKRKATVLNSPTSEGPVGKRTGAVGAASAPVNPFALRLKKRRKGSPALKHQHTIVKGAVVYVPPPETWPLTISAQVVWTVPLQHADGSPKHSLAIYVDHTKCLLADEEGMVLVLDETVTPRHVFKLPSGVKCLLPDADFLYAGCNDGGIYDISHSVPRLACRINGFGQILSLAMYQGVAAVSDNLGHVALVDHRGALLWKHKSEGEFGWMVKADETGVYHGHSAGVTKYSLLEGSTVWQCRCPGGVLYGTMAPNYLFIATGSEVWKIDKVTGKVSQCYNSGKSHTAAVHCATAGGGLVFAGGRKLVCYDEVTGDLVYVMKLPAKPDSMQYFSGRLFCVGLGGLQVVDFTEATIKAAQQSGQDVVTYQVAPDVSAPTVTPLQRSDTRGHAGVKGGVIVECVQCEGRRGVVKARTVTEGYDKSWDVQLPEDLYVSGVHYSVADLRASQAGHFYRVYGEIQEIDEPSAKRKKKS